jgi:hypothetical protein
MAISLSDNLQINFPKPTDARLYNNLTPYTSLAQVTGSIDINYRFLGLTVLVSSSTEIAEYWWKNGVTNNDLILKTAGAGTFLTTASNVNNGNILTISKSDGSSYQITIDTGSGQTYIQGPGIIIGGNNAISASLGSGLEFNGNNIQAQVRTVNGSIPINGNIVTNLTSVLTGPSASNQGGGNNLVNSSSGNATGSIANGTVWVVSGDNSNPDPDGLAYIFVSQSADLTPPAGKWFPLSTLNQDQADLRYVKLNSGGASTSQTITSSLLISGSNLTVTSSFKIKGNSTFDGTNTISGSLTISGSSPLTINGGANIITGSLIVSNSLDVIGTNRITGSLIASSSTPLTVIGGTSTLTGSLVVSNSLDVIGTNRITGSLIVSSSSQIIGTETITGSLIVSSSSNVIGTSRVTGSLIVSNSSQIIGTETITGSLIVSSSSQTIGTNTITGSLIVSNSSQIIGTASITGSLTVSGSTPLTIVGGTNTLSGSFFVSGGLVFGANLTVPDGLSGIINGLHYTTTAATIYPSFVADQNNNIYFQATRSGDIYFKEGTRWLARFRNGGTVELGGSDVRSSPTVVITNTQCIVTGSLIVSRSINIISGGLTLPSSGGLRLIPTSPLPTLTSNNIGTIMCSGSEGNATLYFWNGSSWKTITMT